MKLISKMIMPLLLISVVACTRTSDLILDEFNRGDISKLSPVDSVKLDEYGILMPLFIAKHQDKFIIKKHDNRNFIDIIDTNSERSIRIAKKGRASNEYIMIGSIQYANGNLHVYDISLQKYNTYNIDSTLLSGKEFLKVNQYRFNQTSLGYVEKPFIICNYNDKFITVGLWEDDYWYRLMNKDGYLAGGVERVAFEGLESMAEIEKANLHLSSCISIRPSGDKVVCALHNAPAISVSEIKEDKLVETKRVVYNSPQVVTSNQKGMPLLQYSGSNITSFCKLYTTDRFIYALYSGKRMDSTTPSYQCAHLLIYNWELEPIMRYELNHSINSFCVEGDTLYGVSSYPESRLYVYQLGNI